MKNTLLGIILGISLVLNIAAIGEIPKNLITIKPSKPISTVVFMTKDYNDAVVWAKKGYILKDITCLTQNAINPMYLISMEMY